MRLTLADVLSLAGESDELLDALADAMAPRPPSPKDVVEYFQVPTGSVFNVEPTDAIAYFKAKGLKPTFSYADMLDEAHDSAFTVAKMMDVDMLAQVQASLSDAMANGIPFSQWRDEIIPVMQAGGWWGKKNVVDPVTGQTVLARLGTPGRLKTIFRTNLAASYAAGAWKEIDANKDVAPWLMYDAIDDYRTRPEHASWDRTVLKVGDSWWADHYPPNGYNCRCQVIQLSDDEVAALGLQTDPPGGPQNGTYDWKNPRTGFMEALPWGIDPGFSHHSGKHYLKSVKKTLKEKIDVLPANMQAAASEGVAVTEAAANVSKELAAAELKLAVTKAQKELAKAAGVAHLKHAVEKAHAQAAAVAQAAAEAKASIKAAQDAAKQAEAKEKLDAIVKAGGASTYEKAALKKLLADNEWSALPPSERLAAFENLAASLKAKQLVDTKLAKYKAAVVAGKTPPPNVAKVLDELTPEAKAAFLAKIDAEVAAAKAAEQAAQLAAEAKEFDDLAAASLNDPELGFSQNQKDIWPGVIASLKQLPADKQLLALKQVVVAFKEQNAKNLVDAATVLVKEIDDTVVADLPGGWKNPLAIDLSAISKAYGDQLSGQFPNLSNEVKASKLAVWKKTWADLKAEIEVAHEAEAFKKQTFVELETLAKEAHALGTAEGTTLSNKVLSDMLAGKLDGLPLEALQGYKVTVAEGLSKLSALKANAPDASLANWDSHLNYLKNDADAIGAFEIKAQIQAKIDSGEWASWNLTNKKLYTKIIAEDLDLFKTAVVKTPTASKQWLNVEAAANDVFEDALAAYQTSLADEINAFISAPAWKQGDFTLKAKKIQIAAWKDKLAQLKAPPTQAPPASVAANAGAAQSGVDSLLVTKAPNPATLSQIGPQKGSNPGGLFQDTKTGEKFYVKWFDSPERARNELLTGKLYELLGADTPELAVFDWPDGRVALSSRWKDGLKGKLPPSTISNAEGAYEFFAADAWLANWDVVGAEFDNLVLSGTKAFRVDVGGGLRFRAQGSPKGAAFGDEVNEIDTLRGGNRNAQAVAVFRDIPDDAVLASVRRVLKPSDDQIRQLVEAFGPEGKAERDALLKTLLARREYLRKRFPKAAPPQTTLTVSTTKVRAGKIAIAEEDVTVIAQARMNGTTIKTDGLDVEDHHVLVAHLTGPQGPMTRTSLKLTDAARARIYKQLAGSVKLSPGTKAPVADAIQFDFAKVKKDFRDWVIGVNSRTGKGSPLEAKDIQRAHDVRASVADMVARLEAETQGKITAAAEIERVQIVANLKRWDAEAEAFLSSPSAQVGSVLGTPLGKQDFDLVPASFDFKKIPPAVNAPKATGWTWTAHGEAPLDSMTYAKGHFKIVGRAPNNSSSDWDGPVWEGIGPNGERILLAADPKTQRAVQGTVWIDTPGATAASAQSAFDALQDVFKIDAAAPTAEQVGEQYLNAFARLRLFADGKATDYANFVALDSVKDPAERVAKKLAFLNQATGIQIEKSDGWRDRYGIDPAFGAGRQYQVRPDTDGPEWAALERDHLVYINPKGLDVDAGSGVGDKLLKYFEAGGKMLAQTERLRRGIFGGASTSSDRSSGGGSYVFTRIFGFKNSNRTSWGTGFYLKPKVLRRLDAITYQGDTYGNTTDRYLQTARKRTAKELAAASAHSTSNETIFKESISLFDAIEFVVVEDSELADVLKEARAAGYPTWPDGRRLEEVIIGRKAWVARRNAGK